MLTRDDVTFEVTTEAEDMPIEGNCSAISDEVDAENAAWIREQLDSGNDYAWCGIIVRAYPRDSRLAEHFVGLDSLWGVSARDWAEVESLARDHAMESEALDDLNRQIAQVRAALCGGG